MIRHLATGILCIVLLTATTRAQPSAEYIKFLAKAEETFRPRAEKLDKEYKLADIDRWDYMQAEGQLRFSIGATTKIVATAQILGSYSTYSGTWMWSWANSTVDPVIKKGIGRVKEFGEKRKFRELTEPKFACNEDHTWKLTAAAGDVLDAKGAFRGRIQDGWVYFLITDIRRLDK